MLNTSIKLVLSVSQTNLNVEKEANSIATFDITSNTNWQVVSDKTWLTPDISSGSDNSTITLNVLENLVAVQRTATVTISATGVDSVIISVVQAGATPVLSVSSNSLDVAAEENSTVTFDISSNTSWNIESDMNWVTFNNVTGSGDGSIQVTAIANPNLTERTAIITISGTGLESKMITVIQSGATPVLSVSSNSLDIAAEENSTVTFDISSNTNWDIECDMNWVTLSSVTGSGDSLIQVTAIANPNVTERTATITISGTGLESKMITIVQSGATPVLSVSSNSLDIAAEENSTVTFDISSNTNWNIESDMIWVTLSNVTGSGDGSIQVTAGANPNASERTATITVSANGVESLIIILTQSAGAIGIQEILNLDNIIYPNPTFKILYLAPSLESKSVLILDMNGKIVLTELCTDNKIDVSNLDKGIYMLTIDYKGNRITKKIIKE
jgi:stress response protein SCP2